MCLYPFFSHDKDTGRRRCYQSSSPTQEFSLHSFAMWELTITHSLSFHIQDHRLNWREPGRAEDSNESRTFREEGGKTSLGFYLGMRGRGDFSRLSLGISCSDDIGLSVPAPLNIYAVNFPVRTRLSSVYNSWSILASEKRGRDKPRHGSMKLVVSSWGKIMRRAVNIHKTRGYGHHIG